MNKNEAKSYLDGVANTYWLAIKAAQKDANDLYKELEEKAAMAADREFSLRVAIIRSGIIDEIRESGIDEKTIIEELSKRHITIDKRELEG